MEPCRIGIEPNRAASLGPSSPHHFPLYQSPRALALGPWAACLVARSLGPGPWAALPGPRVCVCVPGAAVFVARITNRAARAVLPGARALVPGPWSLVPGPWWPGRGHGPCSAGRGPVAIRYRTRRAGRGPRTGGQKNGPMPGVRAPWPGFTQSVTGKSVSGPYLEIWVSRETSLWKTPPFD
jgi:hypothetical protein